MDQVDRQPEPEPVTAERSLWRNGDFLLVAGGQTVSLLGSEVMLIAAPLLALAVTGSVAQAAFVSSLEALPYLLFGLIAGGLADRWNRKTIMVTCDVVRAVVLISVPLAYAVGQLHAAHLYVVAFVVGTAFVFFNVAEIASLPQVVGESQLPRATSVTSVAESTAGLVGPGLGGLIVGLGRTQLVGGAIAFLLDGVTYLASAISLLLIRRPLQGEREPAAAQSLWAQIKEGLVYLWSHFAIRRIMLVSAALNLLFSPTYLAIIVLAQRDLHARPLLTGLIFSAGAVGGLVGAVVAPWFRKRYPVGPVLVGAVVAWALAMPLLPLAHSPLLLIAGWALVTFISPVYDVTQMSYRLSLIPENLQGRVNSAFRFAAWGIRPAAIALGGVAVAAWGARPVLMVIASGMALTAVVVASSGLRTVR